MGLQNDETGVNREDVTEARGQFVRGPLPVYETTMKAQMKLNQEMADCRLQDSPAHHPPNQGSRSDQHP